tara:strand:+ start:1550 stop:2323 length:774 start_codon:yes stop_codon:yes gene_type:complete
MKKISFLIVALVITITMAAQETSRQYYQLKIYSFENDAQVQATDDYLKNAFLPALKRMDIKTVGVFKLRAMDSVTPKKTYVLIPFSSLTQFEGMDSALAADKAYLDAGKGYITAAHDKAPFKRIQSILLKAFPDMPVMQASKLDGPREDRVYELRSYEGPTEALYRKKVEMFNLGGEIKLFDRLNFNAVFYSEVLSGSQMPNLMYMTTFANQEDRDAHWKAFIDSPEWTVLKAMPQYQNTVSRNEQVFLYPTEYSDY